MNTDKLRVREVLETLASYSKLQTPHITMSVKSGVHNMYLLDTKQKLFSYDKVTKYLFNIDRYEKVVVSLLQPVEVFIRTYKSQYTSDGRIPNISELKDININMGLVKWTNTYALGIRYHMSEEVITECIHSVLLNIPSMIDSVQVDAIYAPNPIKVISITYDMFKHIKPALEYRGWNPMNSTERLNNKFERGLK